jgi:hypothetical protein
MTLDEENKLPCSCGTSHELPATKQDTSMVMQDLIGLTPGDWIQLDGEGFTVYGKVISNNSEGEANIITSSVVPDKTKLRKSAFSLRTIEEKSVPGGAHAWILKRISETTKLESETK